MINQLFGFDRMKYLRNSVNSNLATTLSTNCLSMSLPIHINHALFKSKKAVDLLNHYAQQNVKIIPV